MPRYVPVKADLCLVEQEIKSTRVTVKKPVNFLWLFDRSGSMSWYLPDLCKQLITLSKALPKDSVLSLGWFSGEGDFDWIFKGFKITDNADYKILESAIKQNSSSRNTTCFSEILADTEQVIKNLSVITKTFSLSFFTDGYPVVSNYSKEINNLFAAIKKIKGSIQCSAFIAFGSHYNKDLMVQMAERLGAMLIHSSQISQYTPAMVKLIKMSENSEPKEEVNPLVETPMATFTVTDQGVVIYSKDEDGKLYINPQKDKSTFVYYISTEKPDKKSWDKVEVSAINFGDKDDRLSKALYSAALVMTQQTKTDVALEIIGKTGDKALVDWLNNAFQVEEYGVVEEKILHAIQDVSARFMAGRDPNYLPAPDAFCVFDMLNLLIDDDQAAFYPYDSRFVYERTSVATKSKDGYPKFEPDKASKCPFNNLTWHETRLNLSVQTKVNGTIQLNEFEGKKAPDLGLSSPYPTFVFRNFSFVKDGHVHLSKFYITTSENTYKIFKNKGIVIDDSFSRDGIYGVDISKLPAINRQIAVGKTSAMELCKAAVAEQKLKAKIKALKWLKDEEISGDFEKPESLTDEQATFLRANGIQVDRGGLFQPPTEKQDPTDFYMAKTFEIKLAGIASLPPAKKVMEKIASSKPRTAVEALMEEGINQWTSAKAGLSTVPAKKSWFEATIGEAQKSLKEIRKVKQAKVFSILLAKKWFDEFSSREDCSLQVDGVTCNLVLGEEKVGY